MDRDVSKWDVSRRDVSQFWGKFKLSCEAWFELGIVNAS